MRGAGQEVCVSGGEGLEGTWRVLHQRGVLDVQVRREPVGRLQPAHQPLHHRAAQLVLLHLAAT